MLLLVTIGPRLDFYLKNCYIPLSSLIKTSLTLISCPLILLTGRNKSTFQIPTGFTCMTMDSCVSYLEPCISNGCLLAHCISGQRMSDKWRVGGEDAGILES